MKTRKWVIICGKEVERQQRRLSEGVQEFGTGVSLEVSNVLAKTNYVVLASLRRKKILMSFLV